MVSVCRPVRLARDKEIVVSGRPKLVRPWMERRRPGRMVKRQVRFCRPHSQARLHQN